jgi:DNA-binding LytR/AlgR family response regulator
VWVVLTDIQIPGAMDGIGLAHYIRDRFPAAGLFVTSGALNAAASQLPANRHFISKPFAPARMLRRIEQLTA